MFTFKGSCFGVRIRKHSCVLGGQEHHSYQAQMLVEDDGNWFKHKGIFDASWIPDIIKVLTKAHKKYKRLMQKNKKKDKL